MMLCQYHHHAYDTHRMQIELGPLGGDGPVLFSFKQPMGVVRYPERGWSSPAVHL